MSSPVFRPFLFKKYVVQVKEKDGSWKGSQSCMSLYGAERTMQNLIAANPKREARILSRYSGRIMRTYSPPA